MGKIRAAITGIGAFLPDYRLTNEHLSTLLDTSDEWIMQRIGIRERHLLKEPGKATSDMGTQAVLQLLAKTHSAPEEIDLVICSTITPDMPFPATANLICDKAGLKNAWSFDLSAACSGFIFGLTTAAGLIESGRYRKIIVIGADMMSSIVDYTDRTTCPLFGDGAAAVLVEPSEDDLGLIDAINYTDGKGSQYLKAKAGGSLYPITKEVLDNHDQYLKQDGKTVFRYAVSKMAEVAIEMMHKHHLATDDLNWFVPHQANQRIINAVRQQIGLEEEKVMVNISRYGNTTAATIPLCLYDYEHQLKKGDTLILASFGAGFTWGSIYLKWAYGDTRQTDCCDSLQE